MRQLTVTEQRLTRELQEHAPLAGAAGVAVRVAGLRLLQILGLVEGTGVADVRSVGGVSGGQGGLLGQMSGSGQSKGGGHQ